MKYMLARIDDALLRTDDGNFTDNMLEAEGYDTWDEAFEHVTDDTIVVGVSPKYEM